MVTSPQNKIFVTFPIMNIVKRSESNYRCKIHEPDSKKNKIICNLRERLLVKSIK